MLRACAAISASLSSLLAIVRLLTGSNAFRMTAATLLAVALGAALGIGLGSNQPAAANVETITSTGVSTLPAQS